MMIYLMNLVLNLLKPYLIKKRLIPPHLHFQSSSNSAGSMQRLTRVHLDVDKSCHLSDSTSTTESWDESSTLSVQDDHLLQLDSTSLSSQDTSSVEIEFVLNLKNTWTMSTFHQQMFFMNIMIMNCSYYIKRLMHHLTISVIRKVIVMKSYAKMTPSSLMPQILV